MYTFPFGQHVQARAPLRHRGGLFVLGAYPSALHVRWTHMPPVAGELIYSNFESQAGIIPSEDNETPATPLHMSYNMVLVDADGRTAIDFGVTYAARHDF